jgi:hypothetical protein
LAQAPPPTLAFAHAPPPIRRFTQRPTAASASFGPLAIAPAAAATTIADHLPRPIKNSRRPGGLAPTVSSFAVSSFESDFIEEPPTR